MRESPYKESYNAAYHLYREARQKGLNVESEFYARKIVVMKIKALLVGNIKDKVEAIGWKLLECFTGSNGLRNLLLLITSTILGFSVVYFFLGSIQVKNLYGLKVGKILNQVETYQNITFLDALYFSGVTFIGLGDSRFTPVKNKSALELLILLEGSLGIVTLGFLLYMIQKNIKSMFG